MSRSAYEEWMQRMSRIPSYEWFTRSQSTQASQESVPDLSDLQSSQMSQGYPRIQAAYRASDIAHRHRLRDSEPYDQQVVAYKRRKRLA